MFMNQEKEYHQYLNFPIDSYFSRYIVFTIEVGKGNDKMSEIISEYFHFEMPCCYLYHWVKDFLMNQNKFDSPIKLIFNNTENESQVEIKEYNLVPLKELCGYHAMDIFVYDKYPSDY